MSNQLQQLKNLLIEIYKNHSDDEIQSLWSKLIQIIEENQLNRETGKLVDNSIWDSSTAVLITYPDAISGLDKPSLNILTNIINHKMCNLSSIVHILPFLESTSDGGFAVSNHKSIDKKFGDWVDLNILGKNHIIMADLVLNHISSSHPWVEQFRKGEAPGKSFILSPSLNDNWEKVFRPRNSPLFCKLQTNNGFRPVWTTFGPDQIDLNWKDPYLLIEFLELIICYVQNGVKWIRLDAVGFIWKEAGTSCIHLEEAHKLVEVFRILIKNLVPDSVLVTETNVPQRDNLSYLKSGNEANIVYNFPLPPLLLEGLITNKCDLINQLLMVWPDLPKETSLLNFTSSHDGIGLQAVRGIMDNKRLKNLLIACEQRGGMISHRSNVNGKDEPYEINISWWSAMSDSNENSSSYQFSRFKLSQILTMSLKGVPAFYLQAILASTNDNVSYRNTGQRRDINRQRFNVEQLRICLDNPNTKESYSLDCLNSAMSIRSKNIAFHPESPMKCLSINSDDLVIIARGSEYDQIIAVHNFTDKKIMLNLNDLCISNNLLASQIWQDILVDVEYRKQSICIDPYEVYWFKRLI